MSHSDRKDRSRLERLEAEARGHPRLHSVRLYAWVLLGYAYPVLLLLAGSLLIIGLLALLPLIADSLRGGVVVIYLVALLFSICAELAILRAFRMRLDEPSGQRLRPDQAPELWKMVEEVRQTTHSPPVHSIYVDMALNAGVMQHRRRAFWGSTTNYLLIGLPLLLALTPQQFRVVLAHEFGHLRRRHGNFRAWIYRVHGIWRTLERPFRASAKWRKLLIGWFVDWYGRRFAMVTLPLRRLHEYDADARSAELSGPAETARALMLLSWIDYRTSRGFWPAMRAQAARDPLPPADIVRRISDFLDSEPGTQAVRRWRHREQLSRTPLPCEHPCLADRLTALGVRDLLNYPHDDAVTEGVGLSFRSDHSAITLLGDSRRQIESVATAAWKALNIAGWRMQHAAAKQADEAAQKQPDSDSEQAPDREWTGLQAELQSAAPDEAIARVRSFISRFPQHGGGNFDLGRLLLNQDDQTALPYLESAIANDSAYIMPALQMMLDYYRDAGRDDEADPIRIRLEKHAQDLKQARTERLKVTRGDRFEPHGLSEDQLSKIRRLMHQYPRIQAAWLARKQIRLFTDKPSYVVAIRHHGRLLDDRRFDKVMTSALAARIELSCAVVLLGRLPRRVRSRLLAACPSPIYAAAD